MLTESFSLFSQGTKENTKNITLLHAYKEKYTAHYAKRNPNKNKPKNNIKLQNEYVLLLLLLYFDKRSIFRHQSQVYPKKVKQVGENGEKSRC